jgi:uncharacterized protein
MKHYYKKCKMLYILFFTLLFCGLAAPQANKKQAAELSGIWLGKLNVNSVEMRLVLKFNADKKGKLNAALVSPDQGPGDIPADTVILNRDQIKVSVKSVKGYFEGKYDSKGKKLIGAWNQMGMNLPITMAKVDKIEGPKRPQNPVKPYPYKEEEVVIEDAIDAVKLAGTLTLPKTAGPYPVVVLITGSGQQDRDETLMNHKPFLIIADYLTRKGIAVLRMDDRGIGGSTGDFGKATSYNFANDISAAVEYLKTRSDINKKQIGLIGHSEGGMIAPIVASKSNDIAFIVLLAGIGIPGKDLLLLQSELIQRANSFNENSIAKTHMLMQSIYNVISKNLDSAKTIQQINEIRKEYLSGLTEEEIRSPENSQKLFDQQAAMLLSPWFRTLVAFNPGSILEKVKCPVLALNGEKDLQVPPKENLSAIKAALTKGGNTNFETIELPGLNHLFQTSKTGNPAEYVKNEETFSPKALDAMKNWLLKIINSGK